MIVVKFPPVGWIGACAVTVFPFCFVDAETKAHIDEKTPDGWATLAHENVHYAEQRRWAIYGLGVGLIVWFALYLLALPALWNPLRRGTETRAYRAQGVSEAQIQETLRGRPYWLWF